MLKKIWVVLHIIFNDRGISRIEEKSFEKCPKFIDLSGSLKFASILFTYQE
jgi:hypothetical protein